MKGHNYGERICLKCDKIHNHPKGMMNKSNKGIHLGRRKEWSYMKYRTFGGGTIRYCKSCNKPANQKPLCNCQSLGHKIWFNKYIQYVQNYNRKHLVQRRVILKRHVLKYRDVVFSHYGAFCHCPKCKETNIGFLTLSHINNDGYKQDMNGTQILKWVIDNNFPSNITIECWNCNCSKLKNNGVCSHL